MMDIEEGIGCLAIICAIVLFAWLSVAFEPPKRGTAPLVAPVALEQGDKSGWVVTLESEFSDSTAYRGVRRIYRLRNGKLDILAVTGCGMVEIGTRSAGKNSTAEHEE